MDKKKKLVIKVNYDSSDKQLTEEQLSLEMTEQSNIKRIIIALLSILLLVIGARLYYIFFKSSSPILNTPIPNSITHGQQIGAKPQNTDAQESRKEVISEPLISEQSKIDKDNNKVFDEIDKIDEIYEDNIVSIEPIYSNQVVRGQLTNRIINNEPADLISSPILVEKDIVRILYYFTELKNMSGKTIYHNWIYQGKSVFVKNFNINGNRWRVTTQKKLNNTLLGDWKVTLTDSKGHLLHEIKFKVTRNK